MMAQASSVLDRVKGVHELPLIRDQLRTIALEELENSGIRQLHARLALVADDKSQLRSLFDSLLGETTPEYVPVISTALRPYQDDLSGEWWKVLHENGAPEVRFRAGLALAIYSPESGN